MDRNKQYQLTAAAVDEISEQVDGFLTELKLEKRNRLSLKLTVEEMLLDWQEHFTDQAVCRLKTGKRFSRPFIQLEVEGDPCNPLEKDAEEYGSYRGRLMANMGLSPIFSYENGKNRLLFRLKKPKANPLMGLIIAVIAALLLGFGGMMMPEAMRSGILTRFLTPIYDAFFNLLGTIAGPMVFLSVAWGICGIGDASTFGRIGKRMVLHFIGMVFLLCSATVLFSLLFFSLKSAAHGDGISQLDGLFRMILGFVPPDIITPFQQGNSLQIILMGAAVGLALLILGKQTEAVAHGIEQINYVIQLLMEVISKLVPAFIFIVLVQMIWSGTLGVVLTAWKPVVVFVLAVLLVAAAMTLLASLRSKTNPFVLLKKALPAAVIAITTASSVAAFGACSQACERKLGVDDRMASFGIPLGIVMFPPGTAMYFLVICLYAAETYAVSCSPAWFLLAVFTAVVLAIASPPIPGGTLTCYTILFTQLGLPEEALVVSLALDVLFDFLATGVNIYCLQLEMVIQARRMNMLDKSILKKA